MYTSTLKSMPACMLVALAGAMLSVLAKRVHSKVPLSAPAHPTCTVGKEMGFYLTRSTFATLLDAALKVIGVY